MLGIAGHLLLGLTDTADGGGQPGRQNVDGLLNGAEISNKGCCGLDIEIAVRQLLHQPVQVPYVAPDQLHGLPQGIGQIAQLIVGIMVQNQVQMALLERLNLPGDVQNGSKDTLEHIHHQADEAEQRQHQADGGNGLHHHNRGVHFLGILVIEGGPLLDHLIQLAHQGGQVGLNGLLIVVLGAGRTDSHHVLHLSHRLMQLLVHGLDLVTQGQDCLVVRASLAVDPLTQNALGIVRARELSVCVQGFAQIAGPLVVGDLRALGPAQYADGLCASLLHLLNPNQIESGYPAEQQNGQQSSGNPVKYHFLNTFTHQ